jgi:hypothetical protein
MLRGKLAIPKIVSVFGVAAYDCVFDCKALTMGKRPESFEFWIGGATIALAFSFKTIFDLFLEEWVKDQLQARFGMSMAEMVERFGAMIVPGSATIAVVWLLYRYLQRDFARQLAELSTNRLEIMYDPRHTEFVNTEFAHASLQKVTRYYVGVRNCSIIRSAHDVTLSADSSLIVENTIEPAWRGLQRSLPKIDPGSTWYVELFGIPQGFGSSDPRDVFSSPKRFRLRVSATDFAEATSEFEFDARSMLAVRKI